MSAADRLFDSIPTLPSVPRVVHELIASLEQDDVDIAALVRKVKQDQTLSARVLRLANSSYYGASHKIGVIDDAIALIGLNALRTMVVTSGITGAFVKVEGIDLHAFWKHALMSASLARLLGRLAGLNGELAYTAGLTHCIGQLVIDMAHPSLASAVMRECAACTPAELVVIEQQHLSTDHCEVGAELARRWHFPAVIQNALRWYAAPLSEAACPYACTVCLADRMAAGLASGCSPDKIMNSLSLQAAERIVIDQQDLRDLIEACAELAADTEYLL